MNNQHSASRSKKGFGKRSKNLWIGLFTVAVGAVCGVVFGLMQIVSQNNTVQQAASAPEAVGGQSVEVWTPRGVPASSAAVGNVQQAALEETQPQGSTETAEAAAELTAQASEPQPQSETEIETAAAASEPVAAAKPPKTAANRTQRKRVAQKKTPAPAQAEARTTGPADAAAAKAPDTSVTAAKTEPPPVYVPKSKQPKPSVPEEPAGIKEPPREPPKPVVTDNLF